MFLDGLSQQTTILTGNLSDSFTVQAFGTLLFSFALAYFLFKMVNQMFKQMEKTAECREQMYRGRAYLAMKIIALKSGIIDQTAKEMEINIDAELAKIPVGCANTVGKEIKESITRDLKNV